MAKVTIQATIPDAMIDAEGYVKEQAWNDIDDALAALDDIVVEDIVLV